MKAAGKQEGNLRAKERGLNKESDIFYEGENHPLTPDEFRALLFRFINERRYVYFTGLTDTNGIYGFSRQDKERSMTYLEYLELLKAGDLLGLTVRY